MRVQSISLRWSLPDTAEKLGTCKMPPRCQISGIPLFSGTGNWGRILCSGKGVQEPRLFMYRGRRARGHSFDFRHSEVGQYVLTAFSTVGNGITSDYLLPKLFNVLAINFGCRIQKTHVLWPNLVVPPPPFCEVGVAVVIHKKTRQIWLHVREGSRKYLRLLSENGEFRQIFPRSMGGYFEGSVSPLG